MNLTANRSPFQIAKDHALSWRFLAPRRKCARLRGIAPTAHSYLFFWARNAIYHSLGALGVSPGDRVLVPSYMCAAAIEPIVAYGAKAVFYAIRPDCSPNLVDLEARIDSRTKALLAVHYFGFPCAISEYREICDRHGLFLIEDCAHVLQGECDGRSLGTFGDASVFSWRKFLPLYDGGELILQNNRGQLSMNWRKESFLFTARAAKSLLDQMVEQTHNPAVLAVSGWLQSYGKILRRAASSSAEQVQALTVDRNSLSFVPEIVDLPMSRISRMIMEHSNLSAIVDKRRANYLYLQDKLSPVEGVRLLFPRLPEGVCPWVLPLFFEGIANAHLLLRVLGIPAVTWGGVRHAATFRTDIRDADFLYENLIFLPIHQGLEQRDLDLIVEGVTVVRQKSQAVVAVAQEP